MSDGWDAERGVATIKIEMEILDCGIFRSRIKGRKRIICKKKIFKRINGEWDVVF